jgi:hypothetical protein
MAPMDSRLFLRSYDLHLEVLEYRPGDGRFRVLTRDQLPPGAATSELGCFTREGARVAGLYPSPAGPVLFVDAERVVGRHGQTAAVVQALPRSEAGPARWLSPRLRRYSLTHAGRTVGELEYVERHGIGTNPYDTEWEDVDLCALMASLLTQPDFFRRYTLAE